MKCGNLLGDKDKQRQIGISHDRLDGGLEEVEEVGGEDANGKGGEGGQKKGDSHGWNGSGKGDLALGLLSMEEEHNPHLSDPSLAPIFVIPTHSVACHLLSRAINSLHLLYHSEWSPFDRVTRITGSDSSGPVIRPARRRTYERNSRVPA